ncbi:MULTISPECIES: putative sulfate exporter family transporter [unclassified Moorena]|uniref:YeiH family protein n=1 Tax=unclassified Moorena TaxID=2683338 RepID=UPI0013C07539|nr:MULTISPECIES: putative sulfate exporter family transporter [unclassified Moorena]NEO04889.1 putative sulfate exporter family transporter [Moorena sp. SIO3I8]NEP26573.1 putative sulfate exporter family transporter [Moorena sp. SIO3I6]
MSQTKWSNLYKLEDWWSVWIGLLLLGTVFSGIITVVPKMPKWKGIDLLSALPWELLPKLALLAIGLCALFTLGNLVMKGKEGRNMIPGFLVIFLLAVLSYILGNSQTAKAINLGYAFWALLIGLIISNTIGTPRWMMPAVRTEYYIKTGLVILGAEILFNRIVEFGPYGLAIAWLVTPIVIIFMYLFGTRVLNMQQKSLVMVVATSTSVCGVSAAIAAAAACKAKKNELTLAVGMTLIFTVAMMVIMPLFVKAVGMNELVSGAWLGGTIDSTGAVVAAGETVGEIAGQAAALVKMIQNMLIGVIAFAIALFWVFCVEREPNAPKPQMRELWVRLPKFILGFIAASVLVSFVFIPLMGMDTVKGILSQTKTYRGWLFCIAFLSIGLDSNFRDLGTQLQGGKPMILYLVGQSFNIVLTLAIAWLMLSGIIFPIPELAQ